MAATSQDRSTTQGYLLLGIGRSYIDECVILLNTIRRQGDVRPASIIVNEDDVQYTQEFAVFDKIIKFTIYDEDLWKECSTNFEKYCLYPRLFLHKYVCYDETIIVDSDILCQSQTDRMWDYLRSKSLERNACVLQLGHAVDLAWHWGTIRDVINKVGKMVPHVHGGLFYLRNGSTSDASVLETYFNYSKDVFYRYDELGCKRWYQNGRVDEIIFAIAHAHLGLIPIDFHEFPIMTFNITPDMEFPTKVQTEGSGKKFDDCIPFLHMFAFKPGHKVFKIMYEKIML